MSNCSVLKSDSFKIPLELLVVLMAGISMVLPLNFPALIVVVNILIFSLILIVVFYPKMCKKEV
jgi:hypothetical protein